MTPMHPGLLQAILDDPADDTPRLILADWLDEHGEAERAAIVRDGCANPAPFMFAPGRPAEMSLLLDPESLSPATVVLAPAIEGVSYTVSRGFVSAVYCRALSWLAHGSQIVREQPIEEATLMDRPCCVFDRLVPKRWGYLNPSYMAYEELHLPQAWFDELESDFEQGGRFKTFPSNKEAEAALSKALICWAKAMPADDSAQFQADIFIRRMLGESPNLIDPRFFIRGPI